MNFKSFLALASFFCPSGFFQAALASELTLAHKTASASQLHIGDPSDSGSEVYRNYDFGKPLLDFPKATEQRWSFPSRHENIEISAASYLNPQSKGDVVFMTGVMDSFSRNLETIYDLYQKGYSVYTFDHRGQGLSSRLAPNPQVVHVQNFSDYSDDFSDFMNIIRPDILSEHSAPRRDLFLVTVSMGALVGAKYIVAHPQVFNATLFVVFCFVKPNCILLRMPRGLRFLAGINLCKEKF